MLTLYPEKTVAIVESEKSALIASAVFPNLVWLGAGNIHGLSIEKCQVLKNRNVILYPDLNAFEKWIEKTQMLNTLFPSNSQEIHFLSPHGESPQRGIEVGEGFRVRCSTLFEDISTPEAKDKGLDVADFLIDQLRKKRAHQSEPKLAPVIQSRFTPELESMIETNPVLLILIDSLQLDEV